MKAATETDSLLRSSSTNNLDGSYSGPSGGRGDDDDESKKKKICYATIVAAGLMVVAGVGGYALGNSSTAAATATTHSSSSTRTRSSSIIPPALQLDTTSSHSYDATQFISFTINTLGGKNDYGECEGMLGVDPDSNTCYLGNAQNLTEDMYHRLAIVQDVLTKLEENMVAEDCEVDRSPNVLKIFSLPEFFLRGPHGAYSTLELIDREGTENDGILIQVADRMNRMIERDTFEDFLFVFGTVLVAESLENPEVPFYEMERNKADNLLYSNFAPVVKGGKGHNHHYLLQKHYISGADFLSRTGTLPNPSKADLHDYAGGDDLTYLVETLRQRNVTLVDDNLIELDGIRMGIEICLDHRLGALWNRLQETKEDLVDVLVVTSAGMAIERGPNPVVPGGVVYLCDGEASSAACWHTDAAPFNPDTTCRVPGPGGREHLPFGGPGYTEFVSLSGCIDVEDLDLKGYYSLHQPQGCANTLKTYGVDVLDEFSFDPPSLEIYPTIALAKH